MDAIEEIKQLKARYFRTMDTKDWDGMRDVFADDVVIDTTESGGNVISRRRRVHGVPAASRSGTSSPSTTATCPRSSSRRRRRRPAIWSMEDMLRLAQRHASSHGYGHYHETYEKFDGDSWRIKTLDADPAAHGLLNRVATP